jgi:hypothetical protein
MENLLNISLVVGAITPIVIGLTEVFKTTLKLKKQFVPMTSVLVGIAVCIPVLFLTGQNPYLGIFGGIVSGLMACGLYSGAKAVTGK